MPLTETLADDFTSTSVNTTRWPDNYNTAGLPLPDQPAGRARVPADTGFAAYASDNVYTLQGSYVHAQVVPPAANGAAEAYAQLLVLSSTVGTNVTFEVDTASNTVLMATRVGFVDQSSQTLGYDATDHAWLRIRESGGTLYWETAPDGRTWTVRFSTLSPSWVSATDIAVQLLAHRSAGTQNWAEFDNVNITPTLADGYTVAVDWNGDGEFDGPYDDVTDDVLARGPVTFEYGRDAARALSPPRVGQLTTILCNADRIYSPENPDSPVASDIAPASEMQVDVVIDDTSYPLMRPRINTFEINTDRSDRSAAITALDGLALLQGTKISTDLYHAQRTGTLIGVILDAIGWTGPRDLDLGATHVPWWWASQGDAFDLLTDLLLSEGPPSIAYVAPDGTFVFRDRHHRLLNAASLTPQAAFAARRITCDSPPVTGFSYLEPFTYEIGWRDIVNDVNFAVEERAPAGELTVIWESDDTLSLTIGQSVQVAVQANDPFMDAQDLETGTDIITTGAGVAVTTISRRSGQTLTITITAVGAALTVTHLQVRARTVPVSRTVQVEADDSTSIARHGLRSYPDDAPYAGAHDAYAITQLLLARYAERRPTVELRIVSSDTAHHLQVVTRAISDLITIRNGELGLDTNFYIEWLQHTVARMNGEDCPGPVHYAVLGCETSGTVVPANPFTFDKTGAGFDQGVFDPTASDNPSTVFIFDHPTQGRFDVGKFAT